MRTMYAISKGLVCVAALAVVFAGCGSSGPEEVPIDANSLDSFTQGMLYAKTGEVGKLEAIITAEPGIVQELDQSGATLLHFAAAAGRIDVVKLLLDNGADPNAMNDDGETPQDLAKQVKASQELQDLLQSAGG
ncbi:MAG: ankyrin repeat domain-containing protein [Candidatus Hydrogenedentes bacterium]|nr:ankyrin repeat domain-containing protein [Candidatus Hydrogenedentota bacterium]